MESKCSQPDFTHKDIKVFPLKENVKDVKEFAEFKDFIKYLLSNECKLEDKWVTLFTEEPKYLNEFRLAFTHRSFDRENPTNNYEYYELIGDGFLNANAMYYYTKKFPQLKDPRVVGFLTRLKFVGISKPQFASLARQMGFYKWIRTDTEETKRHDQQSLLEDTFEAFAGCLLTLADSLYQYSGNALVSKFIETQGEKIKFSLKYRDLYDGKSILNGWKNEGGIKKEIKYDVAQYGEKYTCRVLITYPNSSPIEYGRSVEKFTKQKAEQEAAELTVDRLIREGKLSLVDREIEEVLKKPMKESKFKKERYT